MQDGAVVDKKEPIERSEALEDPEAAAEILIENPEAETYYQIDCWDTGGRKIEELDIELFVEAVLEDADEADEVII